MSLEAVVALGSNLGDRRANLAAGIEALAALGTVRPSPLVLETQDESGLGPDYLNTVVGLQSDLEDPCALLEALLRIELRLGRDRGAGRNAPRTLDLDLIQVAGLEGRWEWPCPEDLRPLGAALTLELPHPRAAARGFVQLPLMALAEQGAR
jgi:2-amino-4-hydroxy-6-hydroxymethyldihydropteridine diphosphokinase